MRIDRRTGLAWALALGLGACTRDPPSAIRVDRGLVLVENHTDEPWLDVEIWLNDHYRVTRDRIAPGERLEVPLDVFVAGFGQRFDRAHQTVKGVEVTAASGGQPVRLAWGSGRQH